MYDGWAISLHCKSLAFYLAELELLKVKYRIGAWCKPDGGFRHTCHPAIAWEPVLFKPARRIKRRLGEGLTRDFVVCPLRTTHQSRGFEGAKPEKFCFWVFDALGMHPEDDFHDLFPGSGGVTKAWEYWRTERWKFRRMMPFVNNEEGR